MTFKSKRAIEILLTEGPPKLAHRLIEYFTIKFYVTNNSVDDDELDELCERIWYFETEDEITYSDHPDDGLPTEFSPYLSGFHPKQPFIGEISPCYLLGPAAAGFSTDGRLILETVGGDFDNLVSRYSNIFGNRSPRDVFAKFEMESPRFDYDSYSHVFPLVPSYDRYYYHWITIYLTRLRMLEKYEQLTGHTPVVLIESDPPSFVKETLGLLGYGPERLIEWQGGKQQVDNLLVSTHRIQNGVIGLFQHSLEDYHWLRRRIRSSIIDSSNIAEGRRIYISRQEAATGRRVVNHDEFMEELASYGIEPFVLESMPIERQLEIIVGSDLIIGPHGAGLANMIFANEPDVIELLPESHMKPSFYMLSDIMGFDYRCIVCESRENHDIVVDLDEVSDVLDDFVA